MSVKTIGIILMVLGILMMAYTGFNYITTKNVVDLGRIQINRDENHTILWSPIVGAVLLVGGVLVILSNKSSRA